MLVGAPNQLSSVPTWCRWYERGQRGLPWLSFALYAMANLSGIREVVRPIHEVFQVREGEDDSGRTNIGEWGRSVDEGGGESERQAFNESG